MSGRFRPTLWPGEVIAAPRVLQVTDVDIVDGEWITWLPDVVGDPRPLPDEFYLREMSPFDFHSNDIEAMAALIERYGVLCESDYQEWSGDYFAWDQRSIAVEMRREYKGPREEAVTDPMSSLNRLEAVTHFDSIRFLREAWTDCAETGGMANYAARYRVTEEHARREFLATLNRGLKLAHARAVDPEAPEEMATIYGVCCLQLYNHIAEDAQFKRCANESCRQVFVRQRGRATLGQHKTEGVKFCTRECARAQAQRELRRRKRYGDLADGTTEEIRRAIEESERMYQAVSTCNYIPDLGEQLKRAREQRVMTVDDVRSALHVPDSWVTGIESGDFSQVMNGSEPWVRGEIREYAELVGLDPDKMVRLYEMLRFKEPVGKRDGG